MKFVAGKARRTAAASFAAAALLGATGCSAINYQATTHQYDPSDGVGHELADVKFADIMFIGAEQDGPARAIGSVVNRGTEDATVELSVDGESHSFTVPAGERVSLEHDENFTVESFGGAPGSFYPVDFSVNGETDEVSVSVLDGTLEEYRDSLPEGFEEEMIEHLKHGPDTWGSGAAHHDDGDGH